MLLKHFDGFDAFQNCLWSGRFFLSRSRFSIIYNSNTIFVFIEMILSMFFFSSFLDFHWNFGWRTPSHHIYVYATYRSKWSCRFASLYIDGFVNESWIYSRSVFFSPSEQISQEWNETNGIKLLEKVSISFCFVTGFNVMRCSSFCAHFVTI